MSSEKNWTEYWSNEGASGEVFVNREGQKHSKLRQLWQLKLADLKKGARLLDVACGAGSIFADLAQPENFELHAADISHEALSILKQRMPDVTVHTCGAADLPFDSQSFDAVVSQFGIEYANTDAFGEASRVLNHDGVFIALCHIEDGYIDSKNKQELNGATLVKETGFISSAINVTRALYTNDQQAIEQALEKFRLIEPLVAQSLLDAKSGVHVHLYNGFKVMMNNLKGYRPDDIISWLEAMDREVDRATLRLTEMRKAAKSDKEMNDIAGVLANHQMHQISYQPFRLPEHDLPLGWLVQATKN